MAFRYRILLAFCIGGISGFACYQRLENWQKQAGDFTFTWRAGQYILSGENPYEKILPEGDYPFQTYFYYPLTAAIASIPFTFLQPSAAGAVFFGLSSFLLAFALSAQGWKHFPVFLSAPFVVAAATAQWSPVILAAALLPPLAFLLTCKPNLGAAVFLYKPTWIGLGSILIFIGLSFIVSPTWPADWLRTTQTLAGHPPPALVLPAGPLLLLSAAAWRKPEGRMFLGLSLFPQLLFFYDQLPLWLIPRSFVTNLYFSGLSWLAYFAWRIRGVDSVTGEVIIQPTQYIMLLLFLPALGMLLWQEKDTLVDWKKRFINNLAKSV
ncbi:MAG: hypothetical protein A2Z16_03535 [Chloroflexi bacterium RBG_16_54_18]|nr:MAG: hypothetical protein A2Z16_03535 [Chloroflexi bacterium RBG_16_54_18]